MTAYVSPELERMAARCRLEIIVGITTFAFDASGKWHREKRDGGFIMGVRGRPKTIQYAFDHAEATRAYVALRAELEKA